MMRRLVLATLVLTTTAGFSPVRPRRSLATRANLFRGGEGEAGEGEIHPDEHLGTYGGAADAKQRTTRVDHILERFADGKDLKVASCKLRATG